MKLFRFGLMKRFKRGVLLTIYPSFKCTHNCSYCMLKLDNVYPSSKTLPLSNWKKFLENYDKTQRQVGGIREVFLSGGEPTILPYFKELLEWMLFEKKWYVTVFSNLSNKNLLKIKPSLRLRIVASYHHEQIDRILWEDNYFTINKVHRVDAEELGFGLLSYSKVKSFLKEEEIKNLVEYIRISPDLSIYMSCYEIIKGK